MSKISVAIETDLARDGDGAFAHVVNERTGCGLYCTTDRASSRAAISEARRWARDAGHRVGHVNGRPARA